MKEQGKNIIQKFKETSTVVVAGAVILILGAFGIGYAAGDSKDSSDAGSKGFHRSGKPGFFGGQGGGLGQGGPGQGGFKGRGGQGLDKVRECLEDEGVKPPSPGNRPSSKDRDKLREAVQKCREELGGSKGRGGFGGRGGGRGSGPRGGSGGGPF